MIDFLIIGGGMAGASAAARLSELGSIVLLESESALGYHASGRSAALFEESYGKPSTVALNAASRIYHETAHGGFLSPRGLMMIGTADTAEDFAADCKTMSLNAMSVEEARAMLPILNPNVVDRAAWHSDALDIDTDRLIQCFAADARANGGRVVTGAGVTAIRKIPTGWVVEAGETYEARVIVNAAGAWVDQVAKLAGVAPLGATPLRRSMGRIPAPGGHDVSSWPMIFGPGETWYAKPDAGALLVSPADEELVEPHDAWADDMVLAEGFARYEAHVTEPVTRLLSSWAGLRTFAPDRSLVLGPDPADASWVWCACQGGYGIQTSPAASQFLADMVGGRPSELGTDVTAQLLPDRLRS